VYHCEFIILFCLGSSSRIFYDGLSPGTKGLQKMAPLLEFVERSEPRWLWHADDQHCCLLTDTLYGTAHTDAKYTKS